MYGFREILQALCGYYSELCTLDVAKTYWQELAHNAQDMTEDEAEAELKRIEGDKKNILANK